MPANVDYLFSLLDGESECDVIDMIYQGNQNLPVYFKGWRDF